MLNYKQRISVVAVVLTIPLPLQNAVADEKFSGSVAAGVASRPDYEGSADNEAVPLFAADINYRGVTLYALGDDLELDVSPYSSFEFGPALSFRNGRDDDLENEIVSRMTPIDDAVEVGGFARYIFHDIFSSRDRIVVGAKFLNDVSSSYDGYVVKFGAGYTTRLTDRIGAGISVSADYASDDYMQTYFGVNDVDAGLTGFDPYTAEAGMKDVSFGLVGNYHLTKKWDILGMYSFKQLTGDSKDSPIVALEGDEAQHRFGIGLRYKF